MRFAAPCRMTSTLTFDLQRTLRRIKPQRLAALTRRSDEELTFARDEPANGPPLLLDTCVYIDILQARDPGAIRDLLRVRRRVHSAVCLAELTHAFGRLDPRHSGTAKALDALRRLIDGHLPPQRIAAPDGECWGGAGMLAGVLARFAGKPEARPFLADALIFLQAAKAGGAVLTRDVAHFDLLNQVLPAARVLFYRPATRARSN